MIMFFEFDGTIVNANAVSQVIATKYDDEYKIMLFRMDGSYMASEKFSVASKAATRFDDIKKMLINKEEKL